MTECVIGSRKIGLTEPPYVIAELSGNHNGDINRALALIDVAADAGADAVKLQTYTADTITLNAATEDFQIRGGLWDGHTLHQLYQWAHTPWEWHPTLFAHAKARGIDIFSSPFDRTAVDFLATLQVNAFKIASFEMIDLPLVRYTAEQGKPIIISSGMANDEEIAQALATIRATGNQQIMLLHCISGYPTPVEQANILNIQRLAAKFNVLVGLSDHTLSNATSVAAVALGARVIEKHFTLARADGGPDSAFSLEPDELKQLCTDVRNAYLALGHAGEQRQAAEEGNRQFRRSLYTCRAINAGEPFTEENVRSVRPGFGLPPKHYDEIMGKRATRDLPFAHPLAWQDIE